MTISDYIKGKFGSFGLQLSEADLTDISLSGGVELTDELTADNKRKVEIAVCGFIPSLLLRPTNTTEGSVSVSYSAQAIKDYYALLCKLYGIEDVLNPKPTVKFVY